MQPGAVKQFGRRGAKATTIRLSGLLDESSRPDASTSRDEVVINRIHHFIGTKHARFETVIDAMARRQDGFRSIVFDGSAVLFLVPTFWFLYRKMWLSAVSAIVVCGIGVCLAGHALGVVLVMIPSIIAFCFGKSLYVRGAAESIRQILATEASPLTSIVDIRAQGGTAPGAVWAALIVTSAVGLVAVLATHAQSWA